MTFNRALPIVLAILVSSCSSKVTKQAPKQYSSETNKSFSEIERENALERYRQLRLEDWDKPEATKKNRVKNIRPKRYSAPVKKIIPKVPEKIVTDPKEQRIEIDQNLKFYCMEKRKDTKFDEEFTCESFTQSILEECESSHQWDDKELTNCIKGKLK